MKKLIIMIIILMMMPLVYGAGVCSLNKDEPYTAGATATLECACTLPIEENIPGFIVFKKENGSIISNVSTNSGSCRTSFFGNSIIVPNGVAYNGTAIFSSDGLGNTDPPNWDGVGDINFDTFSVSTGTLTGCIISDVEIPTTIDLGVLNANVFRVRDSTTNNSISNIQCQAIAFSSDGSPILLEPYGSDKSFYTTGHDGVGYLENTFSNDKFEPHTSYRFSLGCNCLNNSENICFDDNTGKRLGYKTCEIEALFTTGEDKRDINSFPYIRIILFIVFSILGFAFYHAGDKTPIAEKSIIYSILSTTFLFIISYMIWFDFKIIISGNPFIDNLNTVLALLFLILSVWVSLYLILLKPMKQKRKEEEEDENEDYGYM